MIGRNEDGMPQDVDSDQDDAPVAGAENRPKSIRDLINGLQDAVKDYQIDFSRCDLFEEFILDLAGIEEKPKQCTFDEYGRDSIVFGIIMDPKFSKEVVALNKKFPSLAVEDVTEREKTAQANYNSAVRFPITAEPCFVLKMNLLALFNCILPLLKAKAKEDPKYFLKYQRFNFDQSHLRVYDNLLENEGLGLNYSDTNEFENILSDVIKTSIKEQRAKREHLDLCLEGVKGLIKIIADYDMGYIKDEKVDDKKLEEKGSLLTNKLSSSRLMRGRMIEREAHVANFGAVPTSSAHMIKVFFDSVVPGSVQISEIKEDKPSAAANEEKSQTTSPGVNLKIDIQALVHESVVDAVKTKMKRTSYQIFDAYRKEKDPAYLIRSEKVAFLKNLYDQVKDDAGYAPVLTPLKNLIDHLEVDQEYKEKEKMTQLIADLEKQLRELTKQNTKDPKDIFCNLKKEMISVFVTQMNGFITKLQSAMNYGIQEQEEKPAMRIIPE